jgi:hypothetical protein
MKIPCPYCKAVLRPKGLKPGRFQPKCPGCAKPFVLIVPEERTGTIHIQKIAPTADAGPKTDRVPAKPGHRPAPEAAPKPVPKRKLTEEERAALILEGKAPADYEDATAESPPGSRPTGTSR